jgi:hypothetical protein
MKKIIIRKDHVSTIKPKVAGFHGMPVCPLCGAGMENARSAGCLRYIFVFFFAVDGLLAIISSGLVLVGMFAWPYLVSYSNQLFFGGIIFIVIACLICPRKTLRCKSCGCTHQRS